MSAPSPRGQRGGNPTSRGGGGGRGARGAATATSTRGGGRGSSTRGSANSATTRARGGVRGAAPSSAAQEGLLQKLRTGSLQRRNENAGTTETGGRGRGSTRGPSASTSQRGRGRGSLSQSFNTGNQAGTVFGSGTLSSNSTSTMAPTSYATFMSDMTAKWQSLRQMREAERAKAIRDGVLADPEKKTSLDKAITPVGTCTEMCPPFERVERIVQQMVDKAEKEPNDATGRDMPSEDRMVKRFRRSAAGNDEQLPSDIRTPQTLKKTLDYLFETVVGGPDRLASIHKFVWDRTRAVRNDFSIQQVTKQEDVRVAVECYERIARFHILSLHQLSNPDNLLEGENFDAHQEREQLNNTLLSLMYYYDDNRVAIPFPNEPEFRAYCIIFELQSQHPDLEDRMQSWPRELLNSRRVQTAFKLYTAAGNTLFDQGPLRPMTQFAVAQNNSGKFWMLLSSKTVPYMMACVAEIYFAHVRFAALDALWRSGKSAPQAQQVRFQDWTLTEVTLFLGFDSDEQTLEFCQAFDLRFGTSEHGEQYLDFPALSTPYLDKSSIPNQQIFSHSIVEEKRYRRSLVALINGIPAAQAIREGLIEIEDEGENAQEEIQDDDQSIFIPEKPPVPTSASWAPSTDSKSVFGSGLNPQAPSFTSKFGETVAQETPFLSTKFGDSASAQNSIFGQPAIPSVNGTNISQASVLGAFPATASPVIAQPLQPPRPPAPRTSSGTAPAASPFQFSPSGFNTGTATATASTSAASTSSTAEDSSTNFKFGQPPPPSATAAKSPFGGFHFGQPSSTVLADSQSSGQPSPADPPGPSVLEPAPVSQVFAPFPSGRPASTGVPGPFKFPSAAGSTPPGSAARPASISQTPLQAGTIGQQASTHPSTASHQPFVFPAGQSQLPSVPPSSRLPLDPSRHIQPITNPVFPVPAAQTPVAFSTAPSGNPGPLHSEERPSSSPPKPFSSAGTGPRLEHKEEVTESTTPPLSPRQPSQEKRFTDADKTLLITNLAHLSLCQPGGLITEYLEYVLPGLLNRVIGQHQNEVRQSILNRVKTFYLWRKYGPLWRKIAWRNMLNRRASKRRHIFAETIRAERQKKKKEEEELQYILETAQGTKRVQAEIEQAAAQTRAEEIGEPVEQKQHYADQPQLAGKKRKSLSETTGATMTSPAPPRNTYRHHKRSRTIGSTVLTPQPAQDQRKSTSGSFRTSIFSGRSALRSALSPLSSTRDRRLQLRPKQDQTRTDYFKLLARGVDPESPVVPLTEAGLARKAHKEAEQKEKLVSEAWNRQRVRPRPTNSPSPQVQPPKPAIPLSDPAPRSAQPASTFLVDGDDFLKQLREAREAMAVDARWFRDQTAVLEKELQEEEHLRSSTGSNPSAFISTNGLPMANGYEYMPGPEMPGIPLSRTERRIRATGAHGLAYKPLGGANSSFAPVAMSKRSAAQYRSNDEGNDIGTSSPGLKRRRKGEPDEMYSTRSWGASDEEDLEETLQPIPHKRAKGPRQAVLNQQVPAGHTPSKVQSAKMAVSGRFAQLQALNSEGEEDREEDEEELIEEEYYTSEATSQQGQYHRPYNGIGTDGDTEDYDEVDEDEEDDDLIEEEEDDDDDHQSDEISDDDEEQEVFGDQFLDPRRHHQHDARVRGGYGDDMAYGGDSAAATTPGTQTSRAASSAPGASADDALVLSD